MAVKLQFGKEARTSLLKGAEILNSAVSVTLGPAGRNVLFRHGGQVISTKDGVTVAKEINLPGVFESIGADLIKSAAGQTVDQAGDGTTTSTLLAYKIFEAGCKAIEEGAEPTQLVRGIEKARDEIVGEYDAKAHKYKGGILEKFAVPTSEKLAFQAARISSNGDDKIAEVVSRAVLQCGIEGALTIGNSASQDHVLEIVDGMQIDSGLAHPYFINDLQRNRAALDNVTVLLVNRRISTDVEASNILSAAIKASQSNGRAVAILILCDDVDPEALNCFVHNRIKTDSPQIPVVVVRTPLFADARRDLLEDIALLTGARRTESPQGKAYETLSTSSFGYAQRVVVTGSKTLISVGPMDQERKAKEFDPYVARLKTIIADEGLRPDQIDAAKGRLAALTGGVAVIKVGGTSANSIVETKFRVEDAIHATRAAVADGVVPGGGSALLFARETFTGSTPCDPTETKDEALGVELLASVLSEPISQIARNAGYDPDEVIKQVLEYESTFQAHTCGFDAKTGAYIDDMIEEGIVDPLRVVRAGLNAAVSAAATTLLRTEAVIGYDAENTPQQIPGMR